MTEPVAPGTKPAGISDSEIARRLRMMQSPEFIKLAALLGNDLRATQALRVEAEFMASRPRLPRSAAFAANVRGWLIARKLEWTEENLEKAVASFQWPAFRKS
jgi:hypothetical protein